MAWSNDDALGEKAILGDGLLQAPSRGVRLGMTRAMSIPSHDDDVRRAMIDLQAGRFASARDRMQECMRRHPGSAIVWTILGVVEAQLSNMRKALRALRCAITLAPGDLDPLYNYGLTLTVSRRLHPALEYFRRSLAFGPNNAMVLG